MDRAKAEKILIEAYPQWGLDPQHPTDCVIRQAAVHLIEECRKSGCFPDNPTGYWTPVIEAIRASGWHVDDLRGRFELLVLKEGIEPGGGRHTEADIRFCLY